MCDSHSFLLLILLSKKENGMNTRLFFNYTLNLENIPLPLYPQSTHLYQTGKSEGDYNSFALFLLKRAQADLGQNYFWFQRCPLEIEI